MVLSMVSCYMLCWMPYGIMALMATFGRSGLVTPLASVVPSILAKFSTVVNPIIYGFFNNQVRAEGREVMNDDPESLSPLHLKYIKQGLLVELYTTAQLYLKIKLGGKY